MNMSKYKAEFIEKYFDQSIALVNRFEDITHEKWTSDTISLELTVQAAHLAYFFLEEEQRKYYINYLRKKYDFADELCDLAFQIISLWNSFSIEKSTIVTKLLKYCPPNLIGNINDIILICGQINDCILRLTNKKLKGSSDSNLYDLLLTRTMDLFHVIMLLCEKNGYDLKVEYKKMLLDANQFIDSKRNEENIKDASIIDIKI